MGSSASYASNVERLNSWGPVTTLVLMKRNGKHPLLQNRYEKKVQAYRDHGRLKPTPTVKLPSAASDQPDMPCTERRTRLLATGDGRVDKWHRCRSCCVICHGIFRNKLTPSAIRHEHICFYWPAQRYLGATLGSFSHYRLQRMSFHFHLTAQAA